MRENRRHLHTVVFVSGAVALIALAICARKSQADATTQKRAEAHIAQLQVQRVEILRDAVTSATTLFEKGAASYGDMYRRKIILYEAQLELAQTHAQRVELLQGEIGAAKALEEYDALLSTQGKAAPWDANDAKAERLKYEIALAKETMK